MEEWKDEAIQGRGRDAVRKDGLAEGWNGKGLKVLSSEI
jgi:hypothetical protein